MTKDDRRRAQAARKRQLGLAYKLSVIVVAGAALIGWAFAIVR